RQPGPELDREDSGQHQCRGWHGGPRRAPVPGGHRHLAIGDHGLPGLPPVSHRKCHAAAAGPNDAALRPPASRRRDAAVSGGTTPDPQDPLDPYASGTARWRASGTTNKRAAVRRAPGTTSREAGDEMTARAAYSQRNRRAASAMPTAAQTI